MNLKSVKPDRWNFSHQGLAAEWFDGLPVGNGDLGALMIPHQQKITIALAKSNIWDERCDDGTGRRVHFKAFKNFDELRSLIEECKWDEIDEKVRKKHAKWQGKTMLIPAGSLILDTSRYEKEIELLHYERQLNMRTAAARAQFQTRVRKQITDAIVSVDHNVFAGRVRCEMDISKGRPFRAMTFGMDVFVDIELGDPKAKIRTGFERGVAWQKVTGYHNLEYTIAVHIAGDGVKIEREHLGKGLTVTSKDKADFVIYVAITCSKDKDYSDTKAEAIKRVKAAAKAGYKKIATDHKRWWKKFWAASDINIPQEDLLRQYNFGLYMLGSCSRKGLQMPGLQGLWTTKPGGTRWPDYVTDLNIQITYWPIYTSNHLELGWSYYDTVTSWVENSRQYTKEYYKCRGTQYCNAVTPDGIFMPGYLTTDHWVGHAAFIAQNFWTHYLYSRDKKFLRDVAFPFLRDCALFYLDFMKKDGRGLYEIWPSSSPEDGEGSYEAWGKNPTCDISFIKMLLNAVVESAGILGCDEQLRRDCQERLDHMPSYPMRDGALIDMESKEFLDSHRHTGVLAPIYPCSDMEGTSKVAQMSIDRYINRGISMWGCHTITWMVGVLARAQRGEQARDYLKKFMQAHTIPQGGFNLNYDYHRTGMMAGPATFCSESNYGYSDGLLEMLLQSHNGLIRVFPAVPKDWKDVSFETLRAEGAFLVTAAMRNGRVSRIDIKSQRGGTINLKNPWKKTPTVTCNGRRIEIKQTGKIISWLTQRGRVYRIKR